MSTSSAMDISFHVALLMTLIAGAFFFVTLWPKFHFEEGNRKWSEYLAAAIGLFDLSAGIGMLCGLPVLYALSVESAYQYSALIGMVLVLVLVLFVAVTLRQGLRYVRRTRRPPPPPNGGLPLPFPHATPLHNRRSA